MLTYLSPHEFPRLFQQTSKVFRTNELKIYTESGQIDIGCAPAGYMNSDAFLLWSITFINHLNVYRLKFSSSIQNFKAVRILEGHSSRGCPLDLYLLTKANIEVIIEPANTSHIIQMFDVVLALPFKSTFRLIFHRLKKRHNLIPLNNCKASRPYSASIYFGMGSSIMDSKQD
ncbi:hypothetical protein M9Y10_012815 [Tritrichomonas musculus]|uniref:DDE-1 domain-containing protein n=1 Tax=Tritrichomonas musculus TaxID=1915356 RepID=A0ABR2IFB8_9EUKA